MQYDKENEVDEICTSPGGMGTTRKSEETDTVKRGKGPLDRRGGRSVVTVFRGKRDQLQGYRISDFTSEQ